MLSSSTQMQRSFKTIELFDRIYEHDSMEDFNLMYND